MFADKRNSCWIIWYNIDMQDGSKLLSVVQAELGLIADFVMKPKATRKYAERFFITDSSFIDPTCRQIWRELVSAKSDDQSKLLAIASRGLGIEKSGAEQNDFLDCCSPVEGHIMIRVHDLAMAAYRRAVNAAVTTAMATIADCGDAESFDKKIDAAKDAIPKPPPLRASREELRDEGERNGAELPEIPARLLHVPGFIDALTDFSMATAYKPNRTLSFAGALALLAHLAGRKFVDRRNTRTNLFVLAVADTGAGKEHPRRVNSRVLGDFRLGYTNFDQVASGEAIEEILYRTPCALLQIDEIQKLLQNIANRRDNVAQSIARYLLNLYSRSGSTYTLRPKATRPNDIGRTVEDPSLTLFGTGVGHGVYKALTPEAIEEGLVGRCLIFDTEVEGEDNEFKGEAPPLPKIVVTAAEELANINERQRIANTADPQTVKYAEGVNERLAEISKEIREKKRACKAESDFVGQAIWGRAGEKVSKLALVYAVSENSAKPVISREAVEWAWELVTCLVERMMSRIANWMTNGEIDEFARKALKYLKANKGRVTRHEVNRSIKPGSAKMMDEVEALLVDRGDINVLQVAANRKLYQLIDRSKKTNEEDDVL